MPTALRLGPYRFFFYAGDADEPPHVHVERDKDKAKFWLDPRKVADQRRLRQDRNQPHTEAYRGASGRIVEELE
jgi:hypothetical protein